MTHYRFSMYDVLTLWYVNSAANWLSWLLPITPTSPLSMIQGKWYYRAEVVLTEAQTAQSTGPTLHLSPSSNLPQTWKHRKKARSPRWECLSTRRGNWKRVQSMGGKIEVRREKSAKGETARVLTFVQRYRKDDIFQFKSMLNESDSSTSWPTA